MIEAALPVDEGERLAALRALRVLDTPAEERFDRLTRLLTVEQAATYPGRTKEAIQHMVANGKLPTVRSDRRVFVDVLDLDAWIEDNKQRGIS